MSRIRSLRFGRHHDDAAVDAVLAGRGTVPPEYRDASRWVDAFRDRYASAPAPTPHSELAQILAYGIRPEPARRSLSAWWVESRARHDPRLRLVATMLAAALVMGVLATAGALPAPVQNAVAGIAEHLGVHLPSADAAGGGHVTTPNGPMGPGGAAPSPNGAPGAATTGTTSGPATRAGTSTTSTSPSGTAPTTAPDASAPVPGSDPNAPVPGPDVPTVTLPPITIPPNLLPPELLPLPPITLPPITLPPITLPPITLPPLGLPGLGGSSE